MTEDSRHPYTGGFAPRIKGLAQASPMRETGLSTKYTKPFSTIEVKDLTRANKALVAGHSDSIGSDHDTGTGLVAEVLNEKGSVDSSLQAN